MFRFSKYYSIKNTRIIVTYDRKKVERFDYGHYNSYNVYGNIVIDDI